MTEQRYRVVLEVRAGVPVTEVAERYGVSRQSVHAWRRRYRDEGPSGLADRSHKVHAHPWQIPADVESAVCELRRAHPKWGPKRLVFEMDRRGIGAVTRSTVYRVLVRNGLIEPNSRKRRRQDFKRWERPAAMQLWQLDVTASAFLADGREVKIVTGVDDHSRYCVIARAVMRATARPVCEAFLNAMAVYGVPEEVLSDNGTVFTGRFIKPRPAEMLFERICRENGVTQRLTKPASPTTTGKIERLHQSLQNELLNDHGPFESLEALQAALPCPVRLADRHRLRGARRAGSMPGPPALPITVQRRVSERGSIMVATQKVQAGLIHARKIVTVTASDHTFRLAIDGETVATVPRTTSSEIHRYKAYATKTRPAHDS